MAFLAQKLIYIITIRLNFVFGSFFEQDHLLNLFILRAYAKRWPKCALISKQKLRMIHWEKKYGGTGLVSEKMEAFYAELNETKAAAPSSYSATGEFLRYVYFMLVAENYQKIRSRCLVHEFYLTDIFLNSVLYGCGFLLLLFVFLLVCRAMRIAMVSHLLKYFYSFSVAELNNKFLFGNFHAKRVIKEVAMIKILNNCISGRLNNNYFPLNESSSLY